LIINDEILATAMREKDAQEQYDPTSLKYVLIRFGYIAVIIVAISFV